MSYGGGVDLAEIAARAGERKGTIWSLGHGGDLNANLVRFPAGPGVEGHVNDEVDVLLVGVSGAGAAAVDGEASRRRTLPWSSTVERQGK